MFFSCLQWFPLQEESPVAASGKCLPAIFTGGVILTLCVPGRSSVLLLLLYYCFCVGCVGLGQAKLCPDLGILTRGVRLLFLGFLCCHFTSVYFVSVFLYIICSSYHSPIARSLDDCEPLHAGKGWEWWPCLLPAPPFWFPAAGQPSALTLFCYFQGSPPLLFFS